MERIAPSAVLEAQIADLLSRGIDDNEQLAELGRLGTRLVLQRAVEDEVTAFLGRARYARTAAAVPRSAGRSCALVARSTQEGGHLVCTRLVLQRAVEDEVTAFLGRARYERTASASGSRNGSRTKPIQTAEGEITIAMPQVRGSVERFVSRVIPDVRHVVRTRPLGS